MATSVARHADKSSTQTVAELGSLLQYGPDVLKCVFETNHFVCKSKEHGYVRTWKYDTRDVANCANV